MRSRMWYVLLPGAVYANGPWRFHELISAQAFRAHLRRYFKVERLARGIQIWPTTEEQLRIVGECR